MSTDAVFIRGIEFEANHGYTAQERKSTRRFRLNLEMRMPLAKASVSDRIQDTVDYRKISEIAIRIGSQSTFRMLEALAGKIARAIQDLYPALEVIIEVDKLAPPCPGVPASCGVRLHLPAPPHC